MVFPDSDLLGALVGLLFTLLVFSFLIKDNPLFRLTLSIFIGVAAGYAAVLAVYNVIWPQLLLPLLSGPARERLFALAPLALSVLLFFKVSPRLARLGNPAMAFLVGVGAAAAIGGAVLGTLFSQTAAAVNAFDLQAVNQTGGDPWVQLVEGALILIGTLSTLLYFHFGARRRAPGLPAAPGGASPASLSPESPPPGAPQRPEWLESVAWLGEMFIAVTFGALFAGVLSASLAALAERARSIGDVLLPFLR